MTPARAIPVRRQQHVLAQRGEEFPAQRAAVGGRFAVLGPPHLPPAGIAEAACHPAQTLSSRGVDHNVSRIVAHTERHRITGSLRQPAEGYRSRLSDYLNA